MDKKKNPAENETKRGRDGAKRHMKPNRRAGKREGLCLCDGTARSSLEWDYTLKTEVHTIFGKLLCEQQEADLMQA